MYIWNLLNGLFAIPGFKTNLEKINDLKRLSTFFVIANLKEDMTIISFAF